jgi:hypothetical protein
MPPRSIAEWRLGHSSADPVRLEEIGGYAMIGEGCPFLQLDAIESVLVVDAMRGQGSAADPPIDSLLRNVQQSGHVANVKVHDSLESRLRLNPALS